MTSSSSRSSRSSGASRSSQASPASRNVTYREFLADLDAWSESSHQVGKWFRPRCACIEFFRENLADLTDPKNLKAPATHTNPATPTNPANPTPRELLKRWIAWKRSDQAAAAAKKMTLLSRVSSGASAGVAQTTIDRCAATMRGLVATIDAALKVSHTAWRPGSGALPRKAGQRLREATAAYVQAWGLSPAGKTLLSGGRGLSTQRSRALQAMFDAQVPCDEGTGPAWLAVLRLLDYLLGDSTGSPANPVFARILFAGGTHGVIGDLEVVKEEGVPSSWYIDPVSLGLTVLEPKIVDSLRLAWRACRDAEPQTPALRLSPAILDAPSIDGPSAGAVFASAMVAAVRGEMLNQDATASVALRLKDNRSLDDGRPIRLGDIELDDVGGLQSKFNAAHQGRPAHAAIPAAGSLKRVVLTEKQAREVTEAGLHRANGSTIEVSPATTLNDVYQRLTGDARIEQILMDYSAEIEREWEKTWTGRNAEGERCDLLYYVPPHYGLIKPEMARQIGKQGRDDQDHGADAYEFFRGDNEEEVLASLLKAGGDRLCMHEGPGAGKTIFTKRVVAFLSSRRGRDELLGGKAGLAIRREESSLDQDWPEDFVAALSDSVDRFCKEKDHSDPATVVNYALKHGRVTFVLDALDQAEDVRIKTFHRFLATVKQKGWRCRIILTGRTWIVEERQDRLTPSPEWRMGRIEPLDARQQYVYLRGPLPTNPNASDAWLRRNFDVAHVQRLVNVVDNEADQKRELQRLIPSYDRMSDLLSNPQNLQLLREIIASKSGVIPTNRTELYLEISHQRINRDFEASYGKKPPVSEYMRLERMLAAAAFQMMADHPQRHVEYGEHEIDRLRTAAGRRLEHPASVEDWERLRQVTALTSRTLVQAANSKTLAWPDRRMMEFYCGLHLANNADPSWSAIPKQTGPETVPGDVRCGEEAVRRHAANELWRESWIHAMLIPANRRNDAVLLASLAELFEPVTQPVALRAAPRAATRATSDANESIKPWLRPTELMYRAWCLLEDLPLHERRQPSPQRLVGGERILAAFRRQFPRQLEMPGDIGRVAREIRDGFVTVPALQQTSLELTEGQPISIDAFQLGRTAITRAQYLLFDPSWKEVNAETLSGYKDQSLRCPAQFISWYDAWCAARYFGARLPTEAEWEYACAAGSRKRYCRTKSGEDLDTEAGLERVADFGRGWGEGPREVDVGRDLPGGGRRRLEPNAFGLVGMLGGVWEWCVSWDGYSVDEALSGAARNPVGPDRGSARVIRGGSFESPADDCRPALRGDAPSDRDFYLGFRLALSFVGVPAESGADQKDERSPHA